MIPQYGVLFQTHRLYTENVSSGLPEPKGGRTLRQQFAAFPGGRPGMALVLLRLALGITAITESLIYFSQAVRIESLCFGAFLVAAGGFVSIGLLTSYAATALAIATAFRYFLDLSPPLAVPQSGVLMGVLFIAMATAVALLGPGLFSMDFRLFGHREIVIPRRGQE